MSAYRRYPHRLLIGFAPLRRHLQRDWPFGNGKRALPRIEAKGGQPFAPGVFLLCDIAPPQRSAEALVASLASVASFCVIHEEAKRDGISMRLILHHAFPGALKARFHGRSENMSVEHDRAGGDPGNVPPLSGLCRGVRRKL